MQNYWYDTIRHYTERLVAIRSVSPSVGENHVAGEVLRLLRADGLENVYTSSGLDPLPGDPWERHNAYAFLRGRSPRAIVLLGHIDTVDTADYESLESWALDPAGLAARHNVLAAAKLAVGASFQGDRYPLASTFSRLTPGLAEDQATFPGDWMFGRGSADMKSGVAVNIAVMRHLAGIAAAGRLPLSVVFLATPDEENESAGVLQAVHFLLHLRQQYGLEYLGAINTDTTMALYPGDEHRYFFTGTTGKLLPSFLVIGRAAHAGTPFEGIDANLLAAELIRDLSMNDELCDVAGEQITAPPVTLHASDLKDRYDVQLPYMAYFYLNVLTFTSEPGELLERLRLWARSALERVMQQIAETERRWLLLSGADTRAEQPRSRSSIVLTYAELLGEVEQRLGPERVQAELAAMLENMPREFDARQRCLRLVRHLWNLSGQEGNRKYGPAVVIYYSPPYYPHVAATPCLLHKVAAAVAAAHPELHLKVQEYYPYISDMSYLRLDPDMDLAALTANIPTWREPDRPVYPGTYSLPLAAIQRLALPVVDIGPYGRSVHQRDERVLMSYSFGVLPQLICEVIERLG